MDSLLYEEEFFGEKRKRSRLAVFTKSSQSGFIDERSEVAAVLAQT
jgi:hypothetical protein